MEEGHEMLILFFVEPTTIVLKRLPIRIRCVLDRTFRLNISSRPFGFGELKIRRKSMKFVTFLNCVASLSAIFAGQLRGGIRSSLLFKLKPLSETPSRGLHRVAMNRTAISIE